MLLSYKIYTTRFLSVISFEMCSYESNMCSLFRKNMCRKLSIGSYTIPMQILIIRGVRPFFGFSGFRKFLELVFLVYGLFNFYFFLSSFLFSSFF
jgi:hypothetical protein